jgi:hypothetical protein
MRRTESSNALIVCPRRRRAAAPAVSRLLGRSTASLSQFDRELRRIDGF